MEREMLVFEAMRNMYDAIVWDAPRKDWKQHTHPDVVLFVEQCVALASLYLWNQRARGLV